VKILATRLGWVERSDTHRLELRSMMCIGAQRLNPSYKEFFHTFTGIEGGLLTAMRKKAKLTCKFPENFEEAGWRRDYSRIR
jgi:hypothetical protein